MIGSALFGVVGASDLIPAYRLSGGSKLPGMKTLAAQWKGSLSPCLDAVDDFVVDLRSGIYHQLGPIRGCRHRHRGHRAARRFAQRRQSLQQAPQRPIARELVRTRRTVRDINALAAVLPTPVSASKSTDLTGSSSSRSSVTRGDLVTVVVDPASAARWAACPRRPPRGEPHEISPRMRPAQQVRRNWQMPGRSRRPGRRVPGVHLFEARSCRLLDSAREVMQHRRSPDRLHRRVAGRPVRWP